jgi:hypothetical protein
LNLILFARKVSSPQTFRAHFSGTTFLSMGINNFMTTPNDNNNASSIPETSNSKPMDSKQDVAQSPDLRIDEDFRGLQGVPAKEEMLEQSTGSHRVDEKIEEKGTGANASGVSQRYESGNNSEPQQETTPREHGLDGNNEERGVPHNVSNEDLDNTGNIAGTDIQEAAEKGSLNP